MVQILFKRIADNSARSLGHVLMNVVCSMPVPIGKFGLAVSASVYNSV